MKTRKSVLICIFVILYSGQVISQTPFTGKPRYQILTKRGGSALGTFTVELFPNIAPKHVRNFDSLVAAKFYDSLAFHRVIPGFMIQGGGANSKNGPLSTWGQNQPGQATVPAEFSVARHLRGILSAARLSNNIHSAASQFFICVADYPSLNGNYSVYGRVTAGMNYVDTIVLTPKMALPPSTFSSMPALKIEMFVSYIGSNDSVPVAPTLNSPLNFANGIDTLANLQLKWNKVNDAIYYHIEMSTDSLFVNDTIVSLDSPNLNIVKNKFKGNTTYYWRVRVNNGGHYSPYSPVWNFHTSGETTGLISLNAGSGKILSVYPNPSSGKFVFENIEIGSKLEVFDQIGRGILKTTCADNSFVLDMDKRDKGRYTYRLTGKNNKVQSGNFLLQ